MVALSEEFTLIENQRRASPRPRYGVHPQTKINLLPVELIPGEEAEVSADDAEIHLVLRMGDGLPPEEGETDPFEGSTIEWQIESGEGGSLSETITTVEDGLTAVTLSTSTVADTTYVVKARIKTLGSGGADLGDATSWLYTEEIKVVPGATASIELVQDKTSVKSDATDTVEVTATLKDQFDNLVSDGTAVTWLLESPTGNIPVDGAEKSTTDGVAVATLQAPSLPTDQTLKVLSDDASETVTVTVSRVTGSLSSTSSNLDIASGATATITALVDATDGTPVYWLTSNGEITEKSSVSGGSATATLSSADGRLGNVQVTATVGDRMLTWTGQFTSSSGLAMGAERPLLMRGVSGNGTQTLNKNDGTSRDIPYWGVTPVNVQGQPNALVNISFNGQTATALYTGEAIESGLIRDQISVYDMTVNGITIDTETYLRGAASMAFNGTASGSIPHSSDWELDEQFELSMWVNPSTVGSSTLAAKGGSWSLQVLTDGRVQASASTAAGNFNATSTETLSADEWKLVSIQFSLGKLRVKVGSEITEVDTNSTVMANTSAITIGTGFQGNLDDISLMDEPFGDAGFTVTGLGPGNTLQLDASGQGSFTVASQAVGGDGGASGSWADTVEIEAESGGDSCTETVTQVEPEWYVNTMDACLSFIGGDQETAYGVATGITGSVLVVGDVGSVVKQLWRHMGFGSVEPNTLELTFGGIGIATNAGVLVGVGIPVDLGVGALKALAIEFASSPFIRQFVDVWWRYFWEFITGARSLDEGGDAIVALTKTSTASSEDLIRLQSKLTTNEISALNKATDELGDEFFNAVRQLAEEGADDAAQSMIKALDGLSDETLAAIKGSDPALLNEAMQGLAKVMKTNVQPEALNRVLKNTFVYGTEYTQNFLLRDLGVLADNSVVGIDVLVDALKSGSKGVRGVRYELEGCRYLLKPPLSKNVVEINRRIGLGGKSTDISDVDIIVDEGLGKLVYYQLKSTRDAFQKKGLSLVGAAEGWIAKAAKDLAVTPRQAVNGGQIKYAVPDISYVPPSVQSNVFDPGNFGPGSQAIVVEVIPITP